MNASALQDQFLTKAGMRTRRLKLECIELLGRYRDMEGNVRSDPRCKGPDCRWRNVDGTSGGCNDPRVLQFDHIAGGGSTIRAAGHGGDLTYFSIKKKPGDWQLLCANCHAIKTSKQQGGARLHRQPARVRNSQQSPGKPIRRVRNKPDGTSARVLG